MKTERSNRELSLALLASSNMDLLEKPLTDRLVEKGFLPKNLEPGIQSVYAGDSLSLFGALSGEVRGHTDVIGCC